MEINLVQLVKDDFRADFKFYNSENKGNFIRNDVKKINVFSYDKFLEEEIVLGKLNGALDNLQSDNLNLGVISSRFKGLSDLESSMGKVEEIIKGLEIKNRYNLFNKDYWNIRKFFNSAKEGPGKGQVLVDLIGIAGILGTVFSGNTNYLVLPIYRVLWETVILNGNSAQKGFLKEYGKQKEEYLEVRDKINNLEIEIKYSNKADKIIQNVSNIKKNLGDFGFIDYNKVNDKLRKAYFPHID